VYAKSLELVKDIILDFEGERNSDFFKYVLESEKSIISNLALCHSKLNNHLKSIEYDEYIIEKIDKYFDKSYARVLTSYVALNDIDEAWEYYMKLLTLFSKDTLSKHDKIINDFEAKCKKS